MIIIKEDKPKKCPGVTSLFLEFGYNQGIIDIIKKCQLPLWDKKEKKWEVPTSNLSYLLDQFTLIDDIQLELYQQKEKPYIYYKYQEENSKVTPFKHQLEAVEYGLNHDKWLLLDSPGLGKSLSITLLAEELHRQKKIEKCLIICGINSLKRNWEREIKKFSNLSCRIIGQHITKKGNVTAKSIPDRVKELSQPLDEFFIILNIENLRSEDILKAINNGPNKYGLIAFDEIHKCLNYNSIIETDKGKLKIGDIVENRILCKVKSYNKSKNKIEFQPVENWFKNYGANSKMIRLEFLDDQGNLKFLECTEDHKIYTKNRGYVQAKELTFQDDLLID